MKKIAVVTGGAGGIGSAVCSRLCADGYTVLLNYNTSEESALALSSALLSQGFDIIPVQADISEVGRAAYIIEKAAAMGELAAVINNAGLSSWGLAQDVTDTEKQRLIAVDFTAVFDMCRAAVPYFLRSGGGRIVNIASVWGQVGASCEALYSGAKAGVIGLTKALAKELAPMGITVNCVSPGVIDTPMLNRFTDEEKRAMCEEIPMCRMGAGEDVAAAVSAFLRSDMAYVTGQILGVNGGMC